jgi:uncharacterized membrane protein YedE/YeeE
VLALSRADKPPVQSLARNWHAIGVRLAVIAGATTALLALLWHRSVPTACLRGAAVYALVYVVVRVGRSALFHADAKAKGTHPA